MGLLLGVVAIVLIDRNRRFIVGQETDAKVDDAALRLILDHPEVDRVTYLHLEFVGAGRVYLVAAVDLAGNESESSVAVSLRRVEHELELNEHIEEAVLTLSTPTETSLTVTDTEPHRSTGA